MVERRVQSSCMAKSRERDLRVKGSEKRGSTLTGKVKNGFQRNVVFVMALEGSVALGQVHVFGVGNSGCLKRVISGKRNSIDQRHGE